MLAHKAEDEGVACVELIVTGYGHVNYDAIPGVVYTAPEIASVGKTEEQLKEAGRALPQGQLPVPGQRRARAPSATPTAASRSWPTPRPTASSACTSSARAPAT